MLLACVLVWLEAEQRDVNASLREENRVLTTQLGRRRLRLDDDQRRRLAGLGQRLGRALLHEVATLVTPDTILRCHRELIARKWTYARQHPGRPGVRREIIKLVPVTPADVKQPLTLFFKQHKLSDVWLAIAWTWAAVTRTPIAARS